MRPDACRCYLCLHAGVAWPLTSPPCFAHPDLSAATSYAKYTLFKQQHAVAGILSAPLAPGQVADAAT